MRCEWIPPESHRWQNILSAIPHDVYHLPEYARVAASVEGGSAGAMTVDNAHDQFIAPLILRQIGAGRFDALSPYGYPTPLWSQHADATFVRETVSAFVDALRDERIVSAFIRLHPLITAPLDVLGEYGEVVAGGETVTLDLGRTTEELWRDTRENHRRTIRHTQNAGFVARIDDTWERMDGFREAYRQTMTRVDAADYYFFSDQYFTDLRAALGERLHLLVVEHEGSIAAAALFTESCGMVQYHLGGTCDQFLAAAPMKLLFHFARSWFRDRGATVMHLGGGLGSRQDSLFHFKAGFSSGRARFHTWRVIARPEIYRELVEQWRRETGREPAGTFFPAYREPR